VENCVSRSRNEFWVCGKDIELTSTWATEYWGLSIYIPSPLTLTDYGSKINPFLVMLCKLSDDVPANT
jgi:hypothetical protein